jgi:hypothetical protein
VQQPVVDAAENAPAESVAAPASERTAAKAEPARRAVTEQVAPAPANTEARTVTPSAMAANTANAPTSGTGEFLPPQTAPAAAPATPAQDGSDLTAATSNDGAQVAQWALGLGALALLGGGGAMLVRRRTSERVERERRRSPRYRRQDVRPEVVEEPVLASETAPAAAVVAAPVNSMSPVSNAEPLGASAFAHWSPDARAEVSHDELRQHREAMIAEAPSAENPFRTRKARLRRANFLLHQHGVSASSGAAQVTPARAGEEAATAQTPVQQVTYKFSAGKQRQPTLRPKYN